MAFLYLILGLGVVLLNIQHVPAVFRSIFEGAFHPAAFSGGMVGSLFTSMKKGVSRGGECKAAKCNGCEDGYPSTVS